jgi:excisionase family DNA binding protein
MSEISAAKAHRLREIEDGTPVLKGLDEIAAHLRTDPRTLRKMITDGEIKFRRVLGQYRATKQQLDRFIENVGEEG